MAKSKIVGEAFTLTNSDGTKVSFDVGQEVSDEQAKHWFVKAHLMNQPEPKTKAELAAAAKAKAEEEAKAKAEAEAAAQAIAEAEAAVKAAADAADQGNK
jgi:hypothetical protein